MTGKGALDGLKDLITLGRKKGHVTYEEMNDHLLQGLSSADNIKTALTVLDVMGIEVVGALGDIGQTEIKKRKRPGVRRGRGPSHKIQSIIRLITEERLTRCRFCDFTVPTHSTERDGQRQLMNHVRWSHAQKYFQVMSWVNSICELSSEDETIRLAMMKDFGEILEYEV